MTKETANTISLNKYISNSGFCSRREADRYIEQGRVTVNGSIALVGARIQGNEKVAIDDDPIKVKSTTQNQFVLAFHKPVGVTSTTDTTDRSNIISFINHPKRIFPIGRLDKDSEGLIFLTNNGDIVNKILRAGNHHEKEYVVTVNKKITPDFLLKMSKGVRILGETTLPCKVKMLSNKAFSIILTQGLNRQIRRMCEALDYDVLKLKRIRIMHITLGNIPVGKWRYLSEVEMQELFRLIKNSSNTED